MTMLTLLRACWDVLVELAPWLLLGTMVAALMHRLVPARLVRSQLSGRLGVLKAVMLGVPLPLCSCGVIPAGIGLKKDGASDGAAVGFLISTPQTGVDSVLVSASMLGWPFALFKVFSALLSGLVGGWLSDALTPPSAVAPLVAPAAVEVARTNRDAVAHGVEILRSIWRWLAFGVVVSAALTTFLPHDAFSTLGLGALATAGLVLLASLPLYVCATASVPIAAALVQAGMPPGAALIFLMAGPATNLATVGAVYRTFGTRVLAVYLGTIVVASVGLGWLFDFLISGDSVRAAIGAHQHHSWWGVLGAALLVALFVWFAAQELRTWLSVRRTRVAEPAHMVELTVDGMTCDSCAKRVSRALLSVDGVQAADVSADKGRALVSGDADVAKLRRAIREAGYGAGPPAAV